MKYLNYSEEEEIKLRKFNPFLIYFGTSFSLFSLFICISIFFTYGDGSQDGWNWYFSLYSYWAINLCVFAFIFCVLENSIRIYIYSKNTDLFRKNSSLLNYINITRDNLIIISILNSFISTVYYLGYIGFNFSGGYPTLMSHGPQLVLLLIQYTMSITSFSIETLFISLVYCGVYYSFTIILFYKNNGWWVYELQDPNFYGQWYLITIIVILAQIVLYFVLSTIQIIKNKLIIIFDENFLHIDLINEKFEQENHLKDYIKSKLILISIFNLFIDSFYFVYLMICFGYIVKTNNTLGIIGMLFTSLIILLNVLIDFYFVFYIYFDENTDFKFLNVLNFSILFTSVIKLILGITGFSILAYSETCWVFWGLILYSSMEIALRISLSQIIYKYSLIKIF